MRLDFEVTEILWGEDWDREDREGEEGDREDPGGHNTGTGRDNVMESEIRKACVKLATWK